MMSFKITGDVGSENFRRWISAHARKLDVEVTALDLSPGALFVGARGKREMIDALAVACNLGPSSVLVDTVEMLEN